MGKSNGVKEYLKNNKLINIIKLSNLNGTKLAIDASGMIHRAKIHSRNKWWLQFINLMNKFSNYDIKPIIVFDGKPPIEKKEIIEKRKQRQDKNKDKLNDSLDEGIHLHEEYNDNIDNIDNVDNLLKDNLLKDNLLKDNLLKDNLLKINKLENQLMSSIEINDVEICKQICKNMGIPFIHIKSLEADDIFPYLINENVVDGVYSEDNDMFRRGCKKVYFGLDYNLNLIYEFNYDEVISSMNITKKQFNDAYDSAGTDYGTDNLEYCKFTQTIELIIKYGNLENVISNLDKINEGKLSRIIKLPKRFDIVKTREIFDGELSEKVIKQINETVINFKHIFENVKVKYKEYITKIFNDIDLICCIKSTKDSIKESNKYKIQVKEYYKNAFEIYL